MNNGKLEINKDFSEWFDYNHILTVQDLATWPNRKILKKARGDRYTFMVKLPGPTGVEKGFVVKRFSAKPLMTWAFELIHPFRRPSGAKQEWQAMWEFMKVGLPGPKPVAWGQGRGFSAVVSEAVCHVMKLDQWAIKNKEAWRAGDKDALQIKQNVIKELAGIVGKMHASGLHHQDLYLCHFLCGSEKYGIPLTLVDLQRAWRYKKLPRRWRVKDLAQLYFSSEEFATKEDVDLFWTTYERSFGSIPGTTRESLIRAILRKSKRIKRHTEKHGL